ncbi:DnaA regulatory inactivator Hda [Nevskia ramosa]|uniref:DnaA regulatory inactivator Hda n=1 Tax=Nevskia ramosa TaxID=64002 RepID=UPI002352B9FC
MIGEQLPLSVQMADPASFDSFYASDAGPNGQALAALRELAGGDGGTTLIHGPVGCGKTHLLQATSREALSRRSHAAYLPLASFAAEDPAVLQGFETCELICLDDVDAPLQDRHWAQALLRLLDAVKSHGGRCLLSAAMPPDRLAIARMPDLRTRLCASACFALRKLDDNEHAEMLKARGQRLGLALSSDAVHWMLTHLPRDTPSLLAALARIDRAALAARRQPTLPFVRQVLAER